MLTRKPSIPRRSEIQISRSSESQKKNGSSMSLLACAWPLLTQPRWIRTESDSGEYFVRRILVDRLSVFVPWGPTVYITSWRCSTPVAAQKCTRLAILPLCRPIPWLNLRWVFRFFKWRKLSRSTRFLYFEISWNGGSSLEIHALPNISDLKMSVKNVLFLWCKIQFLNGILV